MSCWINPFKMLDTLTMPAVIKISNCSDYKNQNVSYSDHRR